MPKHVSFILAMNLLLSVSLLPAQEQPRTTFEDNVMQLRHPAGISAVAFSPDGKIFAKAYQGSNRVDTKSPATDKGLLRMEFPKPHVRNLV